MKTLIEDLQSLEELSDRELMLKIYSKVLQLEEVTEDIKETIHGNPKKGLEGLRSELSEVVKFVQKYKKYEFAAGILIGFFMCVGSAVYGLIQLFK